jgi:hypothetical protein
VKGFHPGEAMRHYLRIPGDRTFYNQWLSTRPPVRPAQMQPFDCHTLVSSLVRSLDTKKPLNSFTNHLAHPLSHNTPLIKATRNRELISARLKDLSNHIHPRLCSAFLKRSH